MKQQTPEEMFTMLEILSEQFNARRVFNEFIDEVKAGKNIIDTELIQCIDKCMFNGVGEGIFTALDKGTTLYRAREFSLEKYNTREKLEKAGVSFDINRIPVSIGYNRANSGECPLGKSPGGRNNIPGVSYLYLASSPETACAEIKTLPFTLLSLAEFEIQRDLRLLDFCSQKKFKRSDSEEIKLLLPELLSLIMIEFTRPISSSDEYMAAQVLADYIRKAGFDGLAYKSLYSEDGINYTIFNSHERYIKFQNSRLLLHHRGSNNFWDINSSTSLTSEWGDKTYSEEESKKLNVELDRAFKKRMQQK